MLTFKPLLVLVVLQLALLIIATPATPAKEVKPVDSSQSKAFNVTKIEQVSDSLRSGNLSWGVSNLPFGEVGGTGLNWTPDSVSGGFGAGTNPETSPVTIGGGWSANTTHLSCGLGFTYSNKAFNVSISAKRGGSFEVEINGKKVRMEDYEA